MPRPRFRCRCGRSAYSPVCGLCRAQQRRVEAAKQDKPDVWERYARHKDPLIELYAARVAARLPIFPEAKGA